MKVLFRLAALPVGALTLAIALVAAADSASAQVPTPPFLVYGTVTDADGSVGTDVPVLAYIGDVECTSGNHVTVQTGEGDAAVIVYSIDLFAGGQRPGCAGAGSEVRIKIGDRFAPGTLEITDEIIYRFDAVFAGATPAAIPTFTPTPPVTGTPATPDGSTPGTGTDPQEGGTETPGANNGSETTVPGNTEEGTSTGTVTDSNGTGTVEAVGNNDDASTQATATRTNGDDGDDEDGGVPGWAVLAGVAAAAIVVAGGVGGYMKFGRGAA